MCSDPLWSTLTILHFIYATCFPPVISDSKQLCALPPLKRISNYGNVMLLEWAELSDMHNFSIKVVLCDSWQCGCLC